MVKMRFLHDRDPQAFFYRVLAISAVLTVAALIAVPALADTPNPAFRDDGWALEFFDTRMDSNNAVATLVQTDGRIVIVGNANGFYDETIAARFNTDGTLDTSFGDDGFVSIRVNRDLRATDAALQGDGKIVIVGEEDVDNEDDIFVVRLNTDGSLDAAFGDGGFARQSLPGDESARAVAIQTDGRIVAAAQTVDVNNGLADPLLLVRFESDGSLDSSFAVNGFAFTDLGDRFNMRGIALQADGRILVGGNLFGDSNYYVLRYLSSGLLDSTFGTDGVASIPPPSAGFARMRDIAIQSDGRIVLGGSSGGGPFDEASLQLLRLTTSGALDTTFGSSGFADLTIAGQRTSGVEALAVRPDDRIVAFSATSDLEGPGLAEYLVARFDANGAIDTTFNGDGYNTVAPIATDQLNAEAIALQSDGRIIGAGEAVDDLALLRFTTNGSLDTSFSGDGFVATNVEVAGEAGYRAVAVQPDGRVLAAGHTQTNGGDNIAIARFNADGTLDNLFGDGGKVTTDVGGVYDAGARDMALQSDGRIVIVDAVRVGAEDSDAAIIRYNADGSLDTSFGSLGIVTTDIELEDEWESVLSQQDGRILVTGQVRAPGLVDLVVARFLPDGSPDTSFGTAGIYRDDLFTSGLGLRQLSDGRILVAAEDISDLGMLRLTADGTLDTSFGSGGRLVAPLDSFAVGSDPMALQCDGAILLTGSVQNNFHDDDMALARYTAEGALDTSFGIGGWISVDIGSRSLGHSVHAQSDGRILVAGDSGQFLLSRFLSNGDLDLSFGTNGIAAFEALADGHIVGGMDFVDEHAYIGGAAGFQAALLDVVVDGTPCATTAVDSDGDGVPDAEDDFPDDPSETTDTDRDGIGNNADTDDDGDGVPDVSDEYPLGQFADADPLYWAFTFIEALARAGITSGCGGDNYCPNDSVTRAQMAVFLERGMRGSGYVPPPATGTVFADVPSNAFAASFIEQLAADGITSGCGGGNYCPADSVTRAQMAVFLLRAIYGAGYSPPAAIGAFNDVSPGDFAADFIEQLAAEGITSGCGGGNYCPYAPVTRAQMAVFLVRTFGL